MKKKKKKLQENLGIKEINFNIKYIIYVLLVFFFFFF